MSLVFLGMGETPGDVTFLGGGGGIIVWKAVSMAKLDFDHTGAE